VTDGVAQCSGLLVALAGETVDVLDVLDARGIARKWTTAYR
jgi:hypothetical protein